MLPSSAEKSYSEAEFSDISPVLEKNIKLVEVCYFWPRASFFSASILFLIMFNEYLYCASEAKVT